MFVCVSVCTCMHACVCVNACMHVMSHPIPMSTRMCTHIFFEDHLESFTVEVLSVLSQLFVLSDGDVN